MTREELKKIGVPEECIDGVMKAYNSSIEHYKTENTRLTGELKTAETTITTYETEIEAFKGKDFEGLEKEVKTLRQTIADRKAADDEAIRIQNITERFNTVSGESKWLNTYTEDAIKQKFIEAVSDKANNGKKDTDIFNSLVKDEKGNYIEGLFKSDIAPQDIPPFQGAQGIGDMSEKALRAAMGLSTEEKKG